MITTKSKPLMIIILTIVLIIGIGMFLIRPVVSEILASYRDLRQTREDLKTAEEKQQILANLNNQDLQKVASIAEGYIPKDQSSGQLIIELSAIAQANNLAIEQTTIEKSKDATPAPSEDANAKTKSPTPQASSNTSDNEPKKVEFTMKVTGGFTDFLAFLRSLETSTRLISLKNISLQQSQSQDKKTSTLSAQISGDAFYKKDVTLADTLENLKITQETIDNFLNLKTFGQPINIGNEEGFGRPNPFEGY